MAGWQFPGIAHGADYYPEQWLDRPEILEADLEMMVKARVNLVTLGVFAWAMEEPEEGAATAEYAVVLVAATGFAAILVALLKSDTIKTLLTNIVKKALSVA